MTFLGHFRQASGLLAIFARKAIKVRHFSWTFTYISRL